MVSAGAQAPPSQHTEDQLRALTGNAFRLKLIVDRLGGHFLGVNAIAHHEFAHVIYAFARGVDFALSVGDVPAMAKEIPGILRKVYELRNDPFIQPSILLLIISCKNACSKEWFQPRDTADILRMAKELSRNFCTSLGEAVDDSAVLGTILKVMPRYYPHLKFERLITSMEAKNKLKHKPLFLIQSSYKMAQLKTLNPVAYPDPRISGARHEQLQEFLDLVGYNILMADFFIEKNLPREEKIRLLVVQKENVEVSSCITSPPHVSFLVNGKGVDKRTNISMEAGPQLPTDITKMLKYGVNIVQAVGYFNDNYIITVAFVNNSTALGAPKLDDYAQPVTVSPADSDVMEGPSRISLNCPISFRRIKTPVKGCLCKHYQCFDYDNYMEMNSRKPTWRCPYCNTPSNFLDLRIDQKMTKILRETGDDVIDVLMYVDGSWKVAPAQADKSATARHIGDAIQQTGGSVETETSSSQIIDLIDGNDDGEMSMDWASGLEDTKPLLNSQDLSMSDYLPDLSTSAPDQAEDLYPGNGNNERSNIVLTCQNMLLPSTSGLNSSSYGTLESILPQNVLCPIITDAVSPLETSTPTSGMQHASNTVQLQPQIGPLHVSETRRPSIPRNIRREPVGVQALPVPQQNPGSARRLQPNTINCPPPIPLSSPASSAYQIHLVTNLDSVITPRNNGARSLPRTPTATPLLHRQSSTLDIRHTSNHLSSRVVGLPAPHYMGPRQSPAVPGQAEGAHVYRSGPVLDQLMLQTRMLNRPALAASSQNSAAALVRPAQADIQSYLLPAQQRQALRSQAVPRASTPQAVPRAPPHMQPPSVSTTVAPIIPQVGISDGLPEHPVDENWRPTGRMRGSLTGSAYDKAIDRYLGQPSQQQNQTRPPSTSDERRPH